MKNLLGFLALIVIYLPLRAQDNFNPAKKYSPTELLHDYDFLISTLKQTHPSLYWHTAEGDFEKYIKDTRTSIANGDSLTEIDFLQQVALLNNYIHCAHTSFDVSTGYETWWKENAPLIPFNLIEVEGKYYEYLNDTFPGVEIHAINGQPIDEIIETILPYIPADGSNQSRKKRVLKRGFYWYYYLYVNDTSTRFDITYSTINTTGKQIAHLNAIHKKTIDEARAKLKSTKPKEVLNFEFLNNENTGVLTIPTFRQDLIEEGGQNFTEYLDSVFSLLNNSGIKNLVIDLRDNGGGLSEYGAVLLSHIAQKPFEYCKTQRLICDTLISYIDYDIPETFDGFPKGIVKEVDGYKWKKHSVLGTRQPAKNPYQGMVYIITNGKGASTTSEVISVVKTNKLAYIVGEEVGGTYKGTTGGVMGTLFLPNTKLEVRIPLVRYEMAINPDNKSGLLPDYPVTRSVKDWLLGKDTEKEFVLDLIRNRK